MPQPTRESTNDATALFEPLARPGPRYQAGISSDAGFAAILARMTTAERISASRHGGFSRRERSIWVAQFPEEVPLINGEYEWLVRDLADLD